MVKRDPELERYREHLLKKGCKPYIVDPYINRLYEEKAEQERLEEANQRVQEAVEYARNKPICDYSEVPSLSDLENQIEYLLDREPVTEGDIRKVLTSELIRLQKTYFAIKEYGRRIIELELELKKFKGLMELAEG